METSYVPIAIRSIDNSLKGAAVYGSGLKRVQSVVGASRARNGDNYKHRGVELYIGARRNLAPAAFDGSRPRPLFRRITEARFGGRLSAGVR